MILEANVILRTENWKFINRFAYVYSVCEQAPGEDGKKHSASAEPKNSDSEAIGAGSLFAGYKFIGGEFGKGNKIFEIKN